MLRPSFVLIFWLVFVQFGIQFNFAQNSEPKLKDQIPLDSLKFKLKTLGGKQFWTDVCNVGGWRIQENAVSGHFRLLDNNNVRHSSGSNAECQQRLKKLIATGTVKPHSGKVVVVLHGLIRTTHSMRKLGQYLQENSDLAAVDFEYASTRRPVAEHAKSLSNVIQSLGPDVTEINFVGHSLGNIVVRHYLADCRDNVDRRIRRMVMIGPPNNGSKMARVLRRNFLFNVLTGSSGIELGAGWEELETKLVTPDFEFGIIAGAQSSDRSLSNFVLTGKDDFTVSLEETKLSGATDFLVRPLVHSTMMRKPITLESTLRFLEHGYFISEQERNPIP